MRDRALLELSRHLRAKEKWDRQLWIGHAQPTPPHMRHSQLLSEIADLHRQAEHSMGLSMDEFD